MKNGRGQGQELKLEGSGEGGRKDLWCGKKSLPHFTEQPLFMRKTQRQKEYQEKYGAVGNSELLRRENKFIMYLYPLPQALCKVSHYRQT